jgi:hypothetical protein
MIAGIILFAIIAVIGLMIALLGFMAQANSPAPSMYRNNATPNGLAVFLFFGLLAVSMFWFG